ncbi:MAG TPA: dihydroorotate dehydrogenase [Gemmatimonadales bacterium]|nr:dihydroorotate dehydrogenase [Gemmatimonadales bacterium]
MNAPLARTLFNQTFQNPLILAAGTAGYGTELSGVMNLDRLGGIVVKAVSREPRAGNAPPRVGEFHGGMLNSVGLANPGLAEVRSAHLPALLDAVRQCRVLVNVVGFTVQEYADVVAGLEQLEGITAYELNLSCPNTSAGGMEFGADASSVRAVVAACRAVTRRPLSVKLSPALPDIPAMALAARDAGADAISVLNTLPGFLYDQGSAPRLGNGNGGVSGPLLLPAGLLAVRRVVERTGLPVIGTGGVRSAADVSAYLEAGATLVGIGTAALADPRLPERIIRELERAWPR